LNETFIGILTSSLLNRNRAPRKPESGLVVGQFRKLTTTAGLRSHTALKFPVTNLGVLAFIRVVLKNDPREAIMISAKVELTQPLMQRRQFVAQTGSGHHLLLDDAAGGTGPKPIELIAAGLAGCTAFDVVTVLRQKYHQKITGYEVRVEADQADRPPQVFTVVRIHHIVTGYGIDVAALEEAIRLSEEKYCSVGAMVKKTASFHTTYEIFEDKTEWIRSIQTAGVQS
jgi:putative redox protein